MSRTEFHIRAHQILLMLLAFSLAFPLLFSNIIIFSILANHIAEAKLFKYLKSTWSFGLNKFLLIFYCIIFISVLVSDYTNENGAILEQKLAFLAFPVLLYKPIDFLVFRKILLAFVTGVCIALFYCFITSAYQYYFEGDISVFFYHSLAGKMHLNAIYFSAYIVFSLFVLLYFYQKIEAVSKYIIVGLILFLLVGLILLSSKMMLFVFGFGLVYMLFTSQRLGLNGKLTSTFLILLVVLISLYIPQVKNRFLLEYNSNWQVLNQDKYSYNTLFTGVTLRLTIWKHCVHILERERAFIFGVGIGDFQNLLNQEYRNSGMYVGNSALKDTGYLGYGPHNQYVETFFSLGLIGFLFFIFLLFFQFFHSYHSSNQLYFLFVLLNLFFFISESSLSGNKGIVFYVFFTMVFSCFVASSKGKQMEKLNQYLKYFIKFDFMQNSETDKITYVHSHIEKPSETMGSVAFLDNDEIVYPLNKLVNRTIKRLIDIVLSLFVLVFILVWLLPLLALVIKVTSKGGIFFVQARTGYNNQTFNCWKLRSMVRNAEANLKQATSNDMRITFAGKFLRKYSLDELPQFFNVLKGDMSIVGPRPHMLYHTTEFSKEVLSYNKRHDVKPGITGLAQVLGYRGEIIEKHSLHNRIRLDIFYMKKWSVFLDFYIMIKTIKLLIFGD